MIHERIKKICGEKGISISSIEKEAGLSNGSISKWANSNPTLNNLQAVARILKMSIDELVSEKEVG